MCSYWKNITFPIIAAVSLGIFFLLFFVGYIPRNALNQNAVTTTCLITGYDVRGGSISSKTYDCQCITNCPTPTTCRQVCQQCRTWNQRGFINIVVNNTRPMQIQIISSDDGITNPDVVIQQLSVNYPINATVPCYYQPGDETVIQFGLIPSFGYYVSAFVFLGILGSTLIVWGVWAVADYRYNKWSYQTLA